MASWTSRQTWILLKGTTTTAHTVEWSPSAVLQESRRSCQDLVEEQLCGERGSPNILS